MLKKTHTNIQNLHVVPIALEIFVKYQNAKWFYFKGRKFTDIRKILNKWKPFFSSYKYLIISNTKIPITQLQ